MVRAEVVRVSDLGVYLRCPRMVYFSFRVKEEKPRSDLRSLALRHLLYSMGHQISEGPDTRGNLPELERSFSRLDEELRLIYGQELEQGSLISALRELEERLPDLNFSLCKYRGDLMPCEVQVELRSQKLGLSGLLDRLVEGETPIPSLIRAGNPPPEGVWRRDRIMLAGYALLLEEKTGKRVFRGQVEYPLARELRRIDIRSLDRSRALRIRDRLRCIQEGMLPDRPKDAPCESCSWVQDCHPLHSLASRFF